MILSIINFLLFCISLNLTIVLFFFEINAMFTTFSQYFYNKSYVAGYYWLGKKVISIISLN